LHPQYSTPSGEREERTHEMIALLMKGGPVMVPLLVCSVLAVAVMIERWRALAAAETGVEGLMGGVRERLMDGRVEEALRLCEGARGPVAAVLAAGLRMFRQSLLRDECVGAPPAAAHVERAMEELALREVPRLQRRLGVLDTVITVAPLLGLLGTVTGMMGSFHVLASHEGLSQPTAITGGVAEALIATATGLGIAIVTLVAYNALCEKVKAITSEIEVRATQLLNILATLQPAKERLP
jgi:biopolymer transport protein ExbB